MRVSDECFLIIAQCPTLYTPQFRNKTHERWLLANEERHVLRWASIRFVGVITFRRKSEPNNISNRSNYSFESKGCRKCSKTLSALDLTGILYGLKLLKLETRDESGNRFGHLLTWQCQLLLVFLLIENRCIDSSYLKLLELLNESTNIDSMAQSRFAVALR